MPFPASVGALRGISSGYRPPTPPNPELEAALEYEKTRKFLAANLACTMKISQEIIPAHFGKIWGTLMFETRKEIFHDGIFVLVKGISLSKKRRKEDKLTGKKHTPALKFKIVSHSGRETGEGEDDDDDDEEELSSGAYFFEPGSETYALELAVRKGKPVEDLPAPMITPDGKLAYRFQGYLSVGGKHFMVVEIKVPYQGYYNLIDHPAEAEKAVKIETQLNYKRNILSRRKFADAWLTSDASGYLPEETIDFLVGTKNPEKLDLKVKVDLLEKIWYQEPTRRQRTPQSKKLSVKMKEILIASEENVGESGEKEMLWKGVLRLPPGMTPSYKYDFLNSISYILRLTVMVVGDEANGKITGESPIYIGSTRGSPEEDDGDEEGERGNADSEADSNADSNCSGIDLAYVTGYPMMCPSRSMSCIYSAAEMSSTRRPRAGSIASIESSTSSTPSIYRLPPSYSQLSSRRPTLETLPPDYCELELKEQPSQEEEKAQVEDDGEGKEEE